MTTSVRTRGFKMMDMVIGLLRDGGYERTSNVTVDSNHLSATFKKDGGWFYFGVSLKEGNAWFLLSNKKEFGANGNGIRSMKAHLSSILFSI